MLGKLFNLGAASGTGAPPSPQPQSHKPVSSLESVQEDIHTRSLLFPDLQDLYEHQSNQVFPLSVATPTTSSGNSFDYSSDIELDPRDVRIVIMQDALGSLASSLLYDSQAPPPMPSPTGDRASSTAASSPLYPGRATTYPRKPSVSHVQRPIVIQPGSPKPGQSVFDNRSSIYNRTQGYVESDSQRTWREYREELGTFSSCIFGNSELMAYKGTSTKVHVVPSDTRSADSMPAFSDGRGSVGRSSLRASRLSQSFSSESVPPFASSSATSPAGRVHDRKKVLVTRLFPVNLPIEEAVIVNTQQSSSENSAGYPFPRPADDGTGKKKYQPKQKRTPMYAVALVINLPPSSSHSTPATLSRSGFRGPGSYSDHDYFPSSLSSSRPSGWAMVGQAGLGTDLFDTSFGTDIEDHIDAITQHWDIIMRTLNQLQSIVSNTILTMLKQADLTFPDPLPTIVPNPSSRTGTLPGRRSEDGPPLKPPKTNAKHVTLLPNCLQDSRLIGMEAEFAKSRVVAGIRASRVITGQNRWPIWREEARWVAKWVGGREECFLFNLLTGFLATHTDWLQALSPPSYRRRHYLQQKGKGDEDASIPARTIVVAQDKIVARRLIFLLAAFLPASQQLPGIRAHRPSTSASLGPFSQSPPSFVVPILKEESLRRKINRRPGTTRASHSRNLSVQSQNTRASAVPPSLAHLSMEGRHERRVSDAGSIRATQLPIRGGDPNLRKSSAATTGTIAPETSIPHFSIAHRAESFSRGRPTSSNSVAADDLKRITRVDSAASHGSANSESRQGSRWGSVISTLWSARRRESTAGLTKGPSNLPSDQHNSPSSPTKATSNISTRPSGVSTEQQTQRQPKEPTPRLAGPSAAQIGEATGLSLETSGTREPDHRVETTAKPQRTPNPSGAFESPVKTSINLEDGVIDVDIPFPDYLTTFETAVSSPSSSGYLSAPGFGLGLDTFEQSSYISMDRDVPVNVAGWLQMYHPDFVLQAVPVQDGLVEDVKASMRAEPSPTWALSTASAAGPSADKWIDVSTAIIADASTFTIKRLRYRRLVKAKMQTEGKTVDTATTTPVATNNNPATGALSPGAGVGNDSGVKDEFIEETLLSLDDVLVEAVEKVISLNNNNTDTSKVSSSCSSRSTSKRRGERSNSVSTPSDARSGPGHGVIISQEVPRSQCKTVVLSALEEIIREVIEEREQEGSSEFAATTAESTGRSARGEGGEGGSALREAVRRWLDSIEILE